MASSPEPSSKRRRLAEVWSPGEPMEMSHADEAFAEAFESLQGPMDRLSDYPPSHDEGSILGSGHTPSMHLPAQAHDDLEREDDIGSPLMDVGDNSSYKLTDETLELVCFGTITSIGARCERPRSSISKFKVTLESSEKFCATGALRLRGIILSNCTLMINGLLLERSLTLHVSCTIEDDTARRRFATQQSRTNCSLDITIYGPKTLSERFGDWLQSHNFHLQDPLQEDLDVEVKYWNPHRLSSVNFDSCPFVSQVVLMSSKKIQYQEMDEKPDLLDMISGQEDLVESPTPKLLKSTLHRHQKQAITFMLRREEGWALETKGADIWEAVDTTHDRRYFNRIAETSQNEAPPQFYGGIIADPMGLGKTLTMISLAAADKERDRTVTQEDFWDDPDDIRPSVLATLIIVPQPLLIPWEEQITAHVVEGGLKYRRHHGKSRLQNVNELDDIDIVFTTYQTLSAEWSKRKAHDSQVIFSVQWKRIILDEAHLIRNIKTKMAQAICDLEASSRWAVTGTPIQNHLGDLTALLKFVRAHPYDDPRRFDTDISRVWKSGQEELAVHRLKCLSRCLILRRAKRTINLPARRDIRIPVEFSKAERVLYDAIREQTIISVDDALLHDTELSKSDYYVNFLQQIESMRLVCDLGLYYYNRHQKAPSHSDWAGSAQETFNFHCAIGTLKCSQCSSILNTNEAMWEENITDENAQFSKCLKYVCTECCHKLKLTRRKMNCGHTPGCPVAPVSVSNSALEEMSSRTAPSPMAVRPIHSFPSKVEKLLIDLQDQDRTVKSIVFSTWRLTLDIIEKALNQVGICSVRFDGKVAQPQRHQILQDFKTKPEVRVILLTLQCGAVGLTLTEASRAYLMEPHWNPTIEEQALARIHRIGQEREVTTIRFYIRESFEERVMETQESKKNLASVLLSGHDGAQADDSLGALQKLRSLL